MDEKRIIKNYKKMQPPVANFLGVSFGNTWNPDMDATILTIADVVFPICVAIFHDWEHGKSFS